MKTFVILIAATAVGVLSCKHKQDLTPAKAEASKLRVSWVASQENLTATMEEVRNSSKNINDEILRLEKLQKNGPVTVRKTAANYLVTAEEIHTGVNQRMDEINQITHDWAEHSKQLNDLLKALSSEETTLDEAGKIMTDLKSYQNHITPEFQKIRDYLAAQQEDIRRISGFLRRYED